MAGLGPATHAVRPAQADPVSDTVSTRSSENGSLARAAGVIDKAATRETDVEPELSPVLETAFPGEEARYFLPMFVGSLPEHVDEGASLILNGTKTLISSPFWDYPDGEIPFEGALSVLLDGARTPRGIVETTRVEIKPFGSITDEMARAYGEGERTVEWWCRVMGKFYGDSAARRGAILTDDTPLIWEWFVCRAASDAAKAHCGISGFPRANESGASKGRAMSKTIFISLPVADLKASMTFYAAIGFKNNPRFTDENSAWMVWSEAINFMLLTHPKWRSFTTRPIPPKTSSEVMLALSCDSRDAVDAMSDAAAANGGLADINPIEDHGFMYARDLADPDGHALGAMWMDLSAMPAREKPAD